MNCRNYSDFIKNRPSNRRPRKNKVERWQGERVRLLRKASHQHANGEERYRCREGMTWLAGLKREAVSSRWRQWERGGGNDTSQVEKQKARAAWPTLARHTLKTHSWPRIILPIISTLFTQNAQRNCRLDAPLSCPTASAWQKHFLTGSHWSRREINSSECSPLSEPLPLPLLLIELYFLKHPLNYI